MIETISSIFIVIFIVTGIYFCVLSMILPLKNTTEVSKKIKNAEVSAKNLSFAAICFFFAGELYTITYLFIILLAFFLMLVWLNYAIRKIVITKLGR